MAENVFAYLPGRFALAGCLGARNSLRCVLFHDICDSESSFTRGLGVTITRSRFEAALRFLVEQYNPVSLTDVLSEPDGKPLPERPVLVTFDDAYASVAHHAAPVCRSLGVPAVFFVNASCIDNHRLALDNLVCYVANDLGLEAVISSARTAADDPGLELHSMSEVFSRFLPSLPSSTRRAFHLELIRATGVKEYELAAAGQLYLTSQELRNLAAANFEIGNHTYTHVHCRTLSSQDLLSEIEDNKARLEQEVGMPVRCFSVPYGSSADLTESLMHDLSASGHQITFLSESVANDPGARALCLDRVSVHARQGNALFVELEILPRLRRIRNRFSRRRPKPYLVQAAA